MKAIVVLSKRITLEIDERDEMETLHKAVVLSNPPTKCTLCGKTDLSYGSNKDKEGNIYVNIQCTCGGKLKLGQYKAGGYFWHTTFEIYKKKSEPEPEPVYDETGQQTPF